VILHGVWRTAGAESARRLVSLLVRRPAALQIRSVRIPRQQSKEFLNVGVVAKRRGRPCVLCDLRKPDDPLL